MWSSKISFGVTVPYKESLRLKEISLFRSLKDAVAVLISDYWVVAPPSGVGQWAQKETRNTALLRGLDTIRVGL